MDRLARLVGRVRGWRGDQPVRDATGFYRAAEPGAGRRGEVLAAERIDDPAAAQLWRVRHRTVDASGTAVAASMAIAAPPAAGETNRPVVAWVHGAVGVAPGCGPSRSGLDVPYASELLAAGAVVVAPDLTGLGVEGVRHPYLHGTTAGRSVLDAIRAAVDLPAVGAGPIVALAGHSAGGHAVLWANQLAAANDGAELDIRAVVAIAPIGDLAVAMQHYATTPAHAAFLVQLAATWPGVEPVDMADVLTADARQRLTVLDRSCLRGVMDVFRGDPSRWVRPGGLQAGGWPDALTRQSAGRAPGRAPVFVVHGADDGSVLPAWSGQLVDDLRGLGDIAEMRLLRRADHNGVLDAARADIVGLLVDALRRSPP